LTGDLGTGKTHVAVEYAHKFYREHPGSPVYWVDASSSEQFELSYQRIAQALHLASSSGVTRTRDRGSDVLKQVYHALKRDGNGQWLMVLDGLNDESALQRTSEDSAKSEQGTRESMLDFVAKPPFAQVLVTTRDKALAMRLVNQKDSYVINVPGLKDEDAALVLLGKVTTDAAKVERAARVSQALGGSAGALTFAYRYHKKVDSQCSWRRYLDKIQRPESTKSAAAEPGTTAACARRAWQLLYESLQEKHPETASLLRSIGVLDIQSIPRVFFSKSELSGHVRRLIDYGMVEPSADQKVLRVTAIVRRCVQSYLEETKELALVEDKILSLMCDKFDGKDPDTAALLLPTVLATLKFQPSSPAGNGFLATLLFKVAEHYANTGRPQIALRHLERCLILRKENPETRQELIEETQRALDDSRDQLALAKTGETTSAPKPYTPAVADTKRPDKEPRQLEQTTGVHQDSTIRETSELASAQLMQAQGKPEDTVALYQRILDWGQSNYGSNNIDTARFQYNLALAHEENGEYDKAEALYLSASQVIEQHLGPGSPELLRILRSLSCMWCRQGNLDAAERGLSAVLQGQQTAPGMGYNHPETLVTRQNIAMLLEERGQTEAAGAELERVVGLQAHLLGRDHRATLQTACSLAGNYGLRGRRGEAEWLFRETLRAQERTLGKRDRDTVTTAAMLEEFLLRSSSRTVTGADRQHPKMAEVQGGNRPKGSNNNSKGTGALTKESSKTQEQAAYEGILC
jgi:tetratricopeptide (TPR) repeat protein